MCERERGGGREGEGERKRDLKKAKLEFGGICGRVVKTFHKC